MRVSRLIALVLCVSSCSERLAPELSISTDRSSYVAEQPHAGPFVSVTIRNASSHVLELALCGGTDVLPLRERFVNSEWISDPLARCVESFTPLELKPGEVISLGDWNFLGAQGTYRIRVPLYRDSISLEPSLEVSMPFTIH